MWVILNPSEERQTTNFNEKDQPYIAAYEGDQKYYINNSMFSQNLRERYHSLYAKLLLNKDDSLYKNCLACLDCLESFLIQALRIRIKFQEMLNRISNNENAQNRKSLALNISDSSLIAVSSIDIMTDYESMLYHARATLDRLTFFICKQIFRQDLDSFSLKIFNVLENISHKEGVQEAIDTLNVSFSSFQGVLVNFEKKEGENQARTGLRSLLAHSKSHDEAIQGNFSFTFLPNKNFILFDQQLIKDITLLESTYNLLINMPFTVINLISIFSGNEERLTKDDCSINWEKCWISLEEFKDGDDKKTFNFIKINRDSFTILHSDLQKDVLSHQHTI